MAASRWPNAVSSQGPTVGTKATRQIIFEPTFIKMEEVDYASTQKLKEAFYKVEKRYPGFSQEFIIGLLQRLGLEKEVDLFETGLRIAGFQEGAPIHRGGQRRQQLTELENRAQELKKILSTIPDDICDRRCFIELIKLIASAIKQLLDSVTQVFESSSPGVHKKALGEQKQNFLLYCRQFSSNLKDYFKDNKQQVVFNSANRLVNQVNLILMVAREMN